MQNAAEGRFEPFADPNATRPDFHSVRAADVARERVYGNSWHKAAIDSVVWKVRKGSIQSFAALATDGSKADKVTVSRIRSV